MSTTLSPANEAPVVLIVDDKKVNLRRQRDLFEAFGFHTIGANDEVEAYREVMSTPAVDMLFTDVNLHPGEGGLEGNQSGVDLAKEIRKRRNKLPIVVYSAVFDEEKMPKAEAEKDTLFSCIPRKDYEAGEWEKRMEQYYATASNYRKSRLDDGKKALDDLRKKYRIRDIDVEVLRNFIPNQEAEPDSADAVLKSLGYELHLVQAGTCRPTETGEDAQTTEPILFWLRKEGNSFVAELYEHPSIYMHGESVQEAVEQALLLMDGYFRDLNNDEHENSEELQLLFKYLSRVFG